MPIEFYCPGCGNLMRTPDETAGRKGRCPTCQLKVQIPASSVASTLSESAVRRTAQAAPAKPSAAEPIRFDCGSCGKTLSIAAANAGKKGRCPQCGGLISIPLKSPGAGERWKGTPKQQSQPSPIRSPTPAPTPQPALTKAGGEKIEFPCSSCGEVVRVGIAAAGKRGQCPRCKAVIQIPLKSTSVPGLHAIPSDKPMPASPRPQADSAGSSPGLTPLPNNAPAISGLTPLDDDPLSPLEPLGLTPLGPADSGALGDDLFGVTEVDAGNPFGADPNPYSAPVAAPSIPRRPSKGGASGAEIATKICGGCLIFYSVAQIVIFALSLFFQSSAAFAMLDRMREQGNDQAVAAGFVVGQIIAVGLGGIVMLTILAGGIQMIRFKVWGLCLTACILAMMPCNCFCLLGLPIGIWGTVMLSLGTVRSAFR